MQVTHCQICARDIKARTGVVAHHGYQRPGSGWQTASCLGARELPYEESRDAIPRVIESYKATLAHMEKHLEDLVANPPEVIHYYAKYSFEKDEDLKRPDDFDAQKNIERGSFSMVQKYEMEFNRDYRQTKRNIPAIKSEIEWLQNRYDKWVKVA